MGDRRFRLALGILVGGLLAVPGTSLAAVADPTDASSAAIVSPTWETVVVSLRGPADLPALTASRRRASTLSVVHALMRSPTATRQR